ncbi:unnamed protein product [Didymodactylos carnosus]|uniref:Isochorismatase-like domain-containing protein n=1 Tax=Didymodactylos carnosus TaxID=1234261 RepID=A0A813W488_9BILA|nr:unnamed protein product [Didymodactylos carnosus]CAF0892316.1 unnamed protein product [Didymodactylos carnosus]CAF3640092.1 unnamed protein product [Didymodactylos carnosus]CAF3674400.1 unnamed protein product [Didymodactylos carnosus]
MARSITINPNLALLIIDMQKTFESMAKPLIPEINATIASARKANIPVIFSQHGHENPDEEESTSVLVKWWGASGSIKRGSADWQLLPGLDVGKNDPVLSEKSTYDAFHNTRLKSLLDSWNVDTLIISGVLTNLCCETTARSAFVQNYNVIFLSDGTATASDAMHQGTLKTIGFGFGQVMTCADLREKLAKIKGK